MNLHDTLVSHAVCATILNASVGSEGIIIYLWPGLSVSLACPYGL